MQAFIFFIPFIIFMLIGVVAIMYIKTLFAKRAFIHDKNQPETTHLSRVMKKQRTVGYAVENKTQKIEVALITFRKFQDDKEIDIGVSNDDYERLTEGDMVHLTMKGSRYVSVSDVVSTDDIT